MLSGKFLMGEKFDFPTPFYVICIHTQMSKPKEEKKIEVPLNVLAKLLTPSEIRMLKNRWHIINLLDDGLTIRQAAAQAKVGTDTVVRVARMAEKSEVRKEVDKELNTHRKIRTNTPWIFGKNE